MALRTKGSAIIEVVSTIFPKAAFDNVMGILGRITADDARMIISAEY
jgi:hypothetical protein